MVPLLTIQKHFKIPFIVNLIFPHSLNLFALIELSSEDTSSPRPCVLVSLTLRFYLALSLQFSLLTFTVITVCLNFVADNPGKYLIATSSSPGKRQHGESS